MRKPGLFIAFFCFLFFAVPVMASSTPFQIPVPGMVTMVDLGAKTCVPCKMMEPILKKLSTNYDGKAVIAFIDVWQEPEQSKKFKVSMIPTQIFFDKDGKEVSRHVGFMSEKEIVDQLAKMGVADPLRR
ncbi:MAG: thioredoxin family protein [Desulfobulbaceae bacterium]|nr:thioredoxin family protein [Desulfobulbaceae bacterium]